MTGVRSQRERCCLIIGQPNAGKTLFLVNFARFLGLGRLALQPQPAGRACGLGAAGSRDDGAWDQARADAGARRYTLDEARALLVDAQPHTTRSQQRLVLEFRHAKARRRLALVDTPGLSDGIHPVQELRQAMAATLKALLTVDVTLHLVDVAAIGEAPAPVRGVADVDRQLAEYAPLNTAYRLLANKTDLPWARSGLAELRRELPGITVIPVSARRSQGFREVRAFVWDAL